MRSKNLGCTGQRRTLEVCVLNAIGEVDIWKELIYTLIVYKL